MTFELEKVTLLKKTVKKNRKRKARKTKPGTSPIQPVFVLSLAVQPHYGDVPGLVFLSLEAKMIERTKEQIMESLRSSLKQYGVRNKDGSEITDEQVLELCDLFSSGFTLLADEFRKITESVTVIFSSLGYNIDRIGLAVSDEERKKNEN